LRNFSDSPKAALRLLVPIAGLFACELLYLEYGTFLSVRADPRGLVERGRDPGKLTSEGRADADRQKLASLMNRPDQKVVPFREAAE
jgi:hypothetical protein